MIHWISQGVEQPYGLYWMVYGVSQRVVGGCWCFRGLGIEVCQGTGTLQTLLSTGCFELTCTSEAQNGTVSDSALLENLQEIIWLPRTKWRVSGELDPWDPNSPKQVIFTYFRPTNIVYILESLGRGTRMFCRLSQQAVNVVERYWDPPDLPSVWHLKSDG